MRGEEKRQGMMFAYISPEERVPEGHPLRAIKQLCDEILRRMDAVFEAMYEDSGRESIPPETLLKSQVLKALYSIRSDRLLCEQIEYNLLFRWFLDMNLEQAAMDHSTLSRNRDRLLAHEVGKEFLRQVVGYAREKKLLSDEHFTVDGTLIESWASLKSFKPKDDDPKKGNGGGRNTPENFHGEQRTNDTHASTTDPEARLYRKSKGKEAKLYHLVNAITENRHGLVIDLEVAAARTCEEPNGAKRLIMSAREQGFKVKTVGADKLYHSREFVAALRDLGVVPHVAEIFGRRVRGLDMRTVRHASYRISQRRRKLIEECFGWVKTTGGFRKSNVIGRAKTELAAFLIFAAGNLIRICKLCPA